jgi:predicted nucleotidyltransferase
MNKNQALQIIQSHKDELQTQYAVKSLALFGSVARNEATANSDIDLLIEFQKPVGLFHFLTVKNCLQEWLNQKVDLVTYAALKSPLKEQILKELIHVN